jgi:hypothetical protein
MLAGLFCTPAAAYVIIGDHGEVIYYPDNSPPVPGGVRPEDKTDYTKGKSVSDWAVSFVQEAGELDLLVSDIGNNYKKEITRAKFCALAVQLYETVTDSTIRDYYTGQWADSEDVSDTDRVNMAKMYKLGVVSGYNEAYYYDEDGLKNLDYAGVSLGFTKLISREEAAVILVNLAQSIGTSLTGGTTPFTDGSSAWASEAIGKCYQNGIMSGTSATTFGSKESYSVEQSIVTMLAIYKLY